MTSTAQPEPPPPSAHRITGDYTQLRYREDGPVARITLERPAVRNALSMHLSDELVHVLERVRDSTTVQVLVLRGAGGTFCAGDDITEMTRWGTANAVMRRVHGYQHMANVLEELDKVTVAVVEGFAVGGGLELTMAADFVVAAASARWGMPEVDVGITPGWGGTTRLARLIGRRLAKEVNLLGALHPAARAAELGLWNRVVPDDRLDAEADALVAVLLSKNQQALRQLKFILTNGIEADLHTAQAFEALSAGLTGAVNGAWQVPGSDAGAGVAGFVGKDGTWPARRALAADFWADGPVAGTGERA
ncbi:MAG TPA: enoyl-CoA hydratase/isomerase family protein [Actinophytocola sp.]|jgi:enoyl-CoA hydratase|nr:enoyl-CoA hydratase/isomerase family protein [Actinophytocola sp.]